MSFNQKFVIPKEEVCNLVYTYYCPCSKTYTGETKLRLAQRIKSHIYSPLSAINQHLDICDQFKDNFRAFAHNNKLNISSPSSLLSFLILNFKIRRKLKDNFHRRWFEGYLLRFESHSLNRKDDFKFEIRL